MAVKAAEARKADNPAKKAEGAAKKGHKDKASFDKAMNSAAEKANAGKGGDKAGKADGAATGKKADKANGTEVKGDKQPDKAGKVDGGKKTGKAATQAKADEQADKAHSADKAKAADKQTGKASGNGTANAGDGVKTSNGNGKTGNGKDTAKQAEGSQRSAQGSGQQRQNAQGNNANAGNRQAEGSQRSAQSHGDEQQTQQANNGQQSQSGQGSSADGQNQQAQRNQRSAQGQGNGNSQQNQNARGNSANSGNQQAKGNQRSAPGQSNGQQGQTAQDSNANGGNRQVNNGRRTQNTGGNGNGNGNARQSQSVRTTDRSDILGDIEVMRQRHVEPTPPTTEEETQDVNRDAGTNFVEFLRDQPQGSASSEYLGLLEATYAHRNRDRNPLGQYVDNEQVNARLGAIRSGPDGDEIGEIETEAYDEAVAANTEYNNAAELGQAYTDWLNGEEAQTFAESLPQSEREDGSSRRSDFYQEHRERIEDISAAAFGDTRAGRFGMARAARGADARQGLNATGPGAQQARSWAAHSQLQQWDEGIGDGDTSYLTQQGQARLDELNVEHNQALAGIMMQAGRNFADFSEGRLATRTYNRAMEAMAYGQSELPGAEYVNFDALHRDIDRILGDSGTREQVEEVRRSAFEAAFTGATGIDDNAIRGAAYEAWRTNTYGNGSEVYGLNSGAPINTDGLGEESTSALGVPVRGTDVPALATQYNRRFSANWLDAGGARVDGLAAVQAQWHQLSRLREANPAYLTDEGASFLGALDSLGRAHDWEYRPPTEVPDWNAEGVRLDDIRRELRRRTGGGFISWIGPRSQ